jgi:hypothetical protein
MVMSSLTTMSSINFWRYSNYILKPIYLCSQFLLTESSITSQGDSQTHQTTNLPTKMAAQEGMPTSAAVSGVWDFFRLVTQEGQKIGQCRHCPKSYLLNRGSTSGMRYHLRSKHPSLFAKLVRSSTQSKRQREQEMEEVERAEQEAEVQDHRTPKKKRVCRKLAESPEGQGNTIDWYRKYASGDRRLLAFDQLLTRMLVAGSHPFALVVADHFHQFFAEVLPRVTIKSASTFAKNKIPRLHDAMKQELVKTFL